MKSILAFGSLVLAACGNATTLSPYLLSAVVVDPIDPFVVAVSWEPSAGHVSAYTVEGRTPGGSFTDLPFERTISLVPFQVDLKHVVPNGGLVELRVRADPGGFESNTLRYDPGAPVSTVRVGRAPDPSAHAFVVSYGNRNAPQVLLLRRVVKVDDAAGPYIQLAGGNSGPDITYLDTDLSAWADGALYEYRAVSSVAGALPSRSAVTDRALLLTPEVISYLPGPTGAVVVARNKSAHPSYLALRSGLPSYMNVVDSGVAQPGGILTFLDPFVKPSSHDYAHYELSAISSGVTSAVVSFWEVAQSPDAPLQPMTRTLQFGSSAARDTAGNFCIVEPIVVVPGNTASAIFPPGGGASSALIGPVDARLKCRIDSAGQSHAVYFLPGAVGGPGRVTHAWYDGTAWQTELIAASASVNARYGSENTIAFDIGADGTLFAAWYADAQTIEMASQTPGSGWIIQTVPASPEAGMLGISGDETGTPHILTCAFFGNYHLVKGASGWSAERIPTSQVSECGRVEMSVAGGVVSFVSDEVNPNFHVFYVRGNSAGWSVSELPLGGVPDSAHSLDGRDFIVVNGVSREFVSIVRDGVITATPVAGDGLVRTAGFSANGKAWVLEWIKTTDPTVAEPAIATPAFLFEER